MDFDNFFNWLTTEKKFSKRSASDAVSRLRRALIILDTKNIDLTSLEELNSSPKFNNCSKFVKSQLRRTISLYNEFCTIQNFRKVEI